MLKNYSGSQFLNIGFGEDVTIAEFAQAVAEVVGFRGKIEYFSTVRDLQPWVESQSSLARGACESVCRLSEQYGARMIDQSRRVLLLDQWPPSCAENPLASNYSSLSQAVL